VFQYLLLLYKSNKQALFYYGANRTILVV